MNFNKLIWYKGAQRIPDLILKVHYRPSVGVLVYLLKVKAESMTVRTVTQCHPEHIRFTQCKLREGSVATINAGRPCTYRIEGTGPKLMHVGFVQNSPCFHQ